MDQEIKIKDVKIRTYIEYCTDMLNEFNCNYNYKKSITLVSFYLGSMLVFGTDRKYGIANRDCQDSKFTGRLAPESCPVHCW